MADNVAYPVAPGTTIRSVDVGGGVQAQVVLTAAFQEPISFETAAVTSSASLPSIPASAQRATITVEGGNIRYRPDGASTAPTSSVGMLVASGGTFEMPFGQAGLVAVRVIAASGTPTISVVYS